MLLLQRHINFKPAINLSFSRNKNAKYLEKKFLPWSRNISFYLMDIIVTMNHHFGMRNTKRSQNCPNALENMQDKNNP